MEKKFSIDILQSLNFIVFCWWVEIGAVIGQEHEVGSIKKPHKAQGPIAERPQ